MQITSVVIQFSQLSVNYGRNNDIVNTGSSSVTIQEINQSNINSNGNYDIFSILDKMKQLNKVLEDLNKGANFQLFEKDGRIIVQLIQKKDKKVIYQMPPEGILEAKKKIDNAIGLVIDHKK